MDKETIDQTASEVALHRVLWLLKFLRALALHVLLALVAVLAYFLAGIDGLYPLAMDMIHAMRAQALRNQLEGSAIGPAGFAVAALVMFVATLAFLAWIYRSITDVRRRALRFQACLMLIVCVWSVATRWQEIPFAFEHLDLLFAVLATLGVAMTVLVVPVSVAVALWGVSRSPERSSLMATLDPRLALGFWSYVNKLLDLPRAPLHRASTAAAYALALAGAFLLIASVMYLLTAGSTSNKLAALAIACKEPDVMADCLAVSAHWARQIPLGLLLAIAGVKIAALLQSSAKRLGGLSVNDVLKKPDEPFLLYLRPFDTDDIILPKPRLPLLSRFLSFRPFPVRIEEELFDVADGYRPLIAVGKPGGSKEMLGGLAYRMYLEDSEWQDYVADKIRRAERIVMLVKDSEGVRWELARVLRDGAATKTLFLYDPAIREAKDWESLSKLLLPLLQQAGLAPQRLELGSRTIGFFFLGGKLVEIVNANRSATSYRTAFSSFLATSSDATAATTNKAA